jgi:hypothetical protein
VRQTIVAKDLSLQSAEPKGPVVERAETEVVIQSNSVNNTVNALVKYIPTEVVTLYVAAVSATPSLKTSFTFISSGLIYWLFAVMTPVVLLLIYASKRASEGLTVLPPVKELPYWKMAAATVAFLVWALAVPGNPYIIGEGGGVVAGFGAVFISTVMSLLEPIFERPVSNPAPTPQG